MIVKKMELFCYNCYITLLNNFNINNNKFIVVNDNRGF